MIDLTDTIAAFATHVTTATRDEGVIRLTSLMGTQVWMLREIERGLEGGVRSFVFLKGGRQVGGSTLLDLLTLYWLPKHLGMVGEMVSDDMANMKYRRKVLRQMLRSLPKPYRYPTNADNLDFLEIYDPEDAAMMSTLVFDYAGVRDNSNLGRSKGLNFLYADEVGSWTDEKAVDSLKAALSERHPHRFYAWVSTARGYNVWKDMWDEAKDAVSTRRVFVPWWRHEGYRIEATDARWERYDGRMTADEKILAREVKREFGVEIQPEQVVWHRWKCAEEFRGDEVMMAQEFGWVPEQCFQAHGDKFIAPHEVYRLQLAQKKYPKPTGYRYTWGRTIDDSALLPAAPDKAPLRIYKDPLPYAAYIIAGHPWGSSSPTATHWVAQVYQAWPDHLEQVAEYASDTGTTQEFAWILIHLAGLYRDPHLPYRVIEAQGPGRAVEKHLQLFQEHGFGLGSAARAAGAQDFMGACRHYFWTRPDHLGGKSPTLDLQTNATERPYFLHMLADTIVRQQMTIRSEALITSLAGLRRGEAGDNDEIAGGASQSDAHAMCAMLAVRAWQDHAMGDLERIIPKKEQPDGGRVPSMGEVVAGRFFAQLLATGKTGRATRW